MITKFQKKKVQGQDVLFNDKYVTDPTQMAKHKNTAQKYRELQAAGEQKSAWRSDVDAETITLQAAEYADKFGLWKNISTGPTAKVPVQNTHVGYHGKTGERVTHITVKKSKTPGRDGLIKIHGFPSSAPKPK